MTAKPTLVLQLGLGRTGRALVRHYLAHAEQYRQLRYIGVGDRAGLWVIPGGWPRSALEEAENFKDTGMPITRWRPDQFGAEAIPAREAYRPGLLWRLDELGIRRAIVIDATAPGANTAPLLSQLRRAGYDVVLASRAPLAGPQAEYDALTAPAKGRLRWEGPVAAAFPLAEILRRAAWSGRPVRAITAMPSAALGWVLATLAQGGRFSEAVGEAARRGLLHGDPRQDLNGHATARTALLLARAIGMRLEPGDLRVEGLLPAGFETLPVHEVWNRLPDLDRFFAERAWLAGERGRVLRYLAHIGPHTVHAELAEVPRETLAGQMGADETLFALYTDEGGERPVLVQGPGGDPASVAAAVFADIMSLLTTGS
jgi:homoserine dehydrogenase